MLLQKNYLLFPTSIKLSLCFSHIFYREKLLVENGWEIFDIVAEYTRQGVYPSSQWRLTDINKAYKMSPSYPRKILVPASISDEDLVHSSNYRTRGRIPATCWIHPHNKASLTRCAQV